MSSLFKNGIPADILSLPTYTTLLAMYDNYIANANETDVVTNQELAEEVSFLDAVMETKVMKAAHKFLVAQGNIQTLLTNRYFRILIHHF